MVDEKTQNNCQNKVVRCQTLKRGKSVGELKPITPMTLINISITRLLFFMILLIGLNYLLTNKDKEGDLLDAHCHHKKYNPLMSFEKLGCLKKLLYDY